MWGQWHRITVTPVPGTWDLDPFWTLVDRSSTTIWRDKTRFIQFLSVSLTRFSSSGTIVGVGATGVGDHTAVGSVRAKLTSESEVVLAPSQSSQ